MRRDQPAILCAILRYPDRWPPQTAVMLDRRARERRRTAQPVAADRRQRQRRTSPDALWLAQGFTVVHVDDLPAEAIALDEIPVMSEAPGPA